MNNNSLVLLIFDSHTPKVKIMSDKRVAESALEGLGRRVSHLMYSYIQTFIAISVTRAALKW